ncbi:MAG: endo alpha-1,4 polygalactosaminidase [bacterium]
MRNSLKKSLVEIPGLAASFAAALFVLISCGGGGGKPPDDWPPINPPPQPGPADLRKERMDAVQSWGYVLQFGEDATLEALAATSFDLLVIDYSADGGDDGAFSADDIATLKSGKANRIVLAYLSIGEAEDYRWYFDPAWVDEDGMPRLSAPDWLGPTNPDWPGNYKVRYWDGDWQALLMGDGGGEGYLDRIAVAGFDGVYLDIVDAYEYWGPDGDAYERDDAAFLMAQLVARIAQRGRQLRGNSFLVVPQNATHLYAELETRYRDEYLEAIDGIGVEDVFFFGELDMDNPLNVQNDILADLRALRQAGERILSVEYLSNPTLLNAYFPLARAEGFVPLAAGRELDAIPSPPPS